MSSTSIIAALPMYDWPERRAEVDAEWVTIRDRLRLQGVPAPDTLTRRNSDMPPVPGGIRDDKGNLIAVDPAVLPPDGLDLPTLWRHPALIYAQTCYGPMECGLCAHVTVIADPDYSGIEGGAGRDYSSVLVMNRTMAPAAILEKGDVPAPSDGRATIEAATMPGLRVAFNERQSMSGYLALQKDLVSVGKDMQHFAAQIETGAHRISLRFVAEGKADLAAIDARSWALAKIYSPDVTARLMAVGWTSQRPGLPFITAKAHAHYFTG